MDTNNPTESSHPLPPESESTQIQPKNKIRVVYNFFISLNISLLILFVVSNFIFNTCTANDLGCGLGVLTFIFLGPPFLIIFLLGIMNVIYDHNKGISVKNFNEIKHSRIFKQYIILTILLLILNLIPIINKTYYDFLSRQKNEKNQQSFNYRLINNNQNKSNIYLIRNRIIKYQNENKLVPESLSSLGIPPNILIDAYTKKQFIYYYNQAKLRFAVCANLMFAGTKGDYFNITCHMGSRDYDFQSYSEVEDALNKPDLYP